MKSQSALFLSAVLASAFLLPLTACDGGAEEAGETIDEAVDDAADAVEGVVDDAKD
jgi:hypothetical protein